MLRSRRLLNPARSVELNCSATGPSNGAKSQDGALLPLHGASPCITKDKTSEKGQKATQVHLLTPENETDRCPSFKQ